MRNAIAKLLLSLANRVATAKTISSARGNWQFRREWFAEPYNVNQEKGERDEEISKADT